MTGMQKEDISMTIRHLFIFKTVCEEESITGAAGKLFMTQPAVSHAVAELEGEAGTPLFDRVGRKIRLNRRGELIYEKACTVLEVYGDLQKSMKDLEHRLALRIGSSITIANFWLPGLIRKFTDAFGSIQVRVTVDSARSIARCLVASEIDLAVVEGASYQEKFESIPFSSYRVIPLCSRKYMEERLRPAAAERAGGDREKTGKMAGKLVLPAKALSGESLLLREKGSAIRDVLDGAMLQQDLELPASWVSVNSQSLISAAVSGLGITFLPDIMAEEFLKNGSLVTFEIEGVELRNENHLALPRGRYLSAPMKGFVELVTGGEKNQAFYNAAPVLR